MCTNLEADLTGDASPRRHVRPIRSLCTLGADREQIKNAADAGCDALWLDLEEPTWPYGPVERAHAREVYADYLAEVTAAGSVEPNGPRIFVRVSSVASGEIVADLQSIASPALSGVIIPKADSPADVVEIDTIVATVEASSGIEIGKLELLPLLETANGMRLAYEIACASPRVTYMYSGLSKYGDVQRALGYTWTPRGEETLYYRQKLIMDARAAGIRYPIGPAWRGAADDIDGFTAWATSLRRMGYRGMTVSAARAAQANVIFSPAVEEIEYWHELVQRCESLAPGESSFEFVDPSGTRGPMREAFLETAHYVLAWARDLGLYDGTDPAH